VGDILHSPVQIMDPDVNSCFCEDPVRARAVRRRLLAEAADSSLLVFPGHFGGHSACRVSGTGSGAFVIADWADFARI
jgi:glyoxylase-like metal-dependent hydrolase (beta-lactamase superfamily II)